MFFVLDSTVVSQLCAPARHAALANWFASLVRNVATRGVILPAIVDYEVRRGLLHLALRAGRVETKAIRRLNELVRECTFRHLSTQELRSAALLWAQARHAGSPTAHPHHLDGDAILAAQARSVSATIVTDNLRHLERFGPARRWEDIDPNPLA